MAIYRAEYHAGRLHELYAFQEVRGKVGLAYSIYSYLSSYRECGVLAMYAATTPRYVKQTIDVIVKQLEMLKHGDFGGISLNDVKTQIKGNLFSPERARAIECHPLQRTRCITVEIFR